MRFVFTISLLLAIFAAGIPLMDLDPVSIAIRFGIFITILLIVSGYQLYQSYWSKNG